MVIGTYALAAKGMRFADLGLLIIDEEQKFGAKQKAILRASAKAAHVLTLTATPIPRTLQSALVGLQDLSVIATPPFLRQSTRTVIAAFDKSLVRRHAAAAVFSARADLLPALRQADRHRHVDLADAAVLLFVPAAVDHVPAGVLAVRSAARFPAGSG